VISSGGNDALGQQSLLYQEMGRAGEDFFMLGAAAQTFEREYRELLRAALDTRLPTIVYARSTMATSPIRRSSWYCRRR
jgi:hypothetical protein